MTYLEKPTTVVIDDDFVTVDDSDDITDAVGTDDWDYALVCDD